MRLILILAIFTATLTALTFEQTSQMERFNQKRNVSGKYDKCILEITAAIAKIGVIVSDIVVSNWVGVVAQIAALGKEIYEIVECFRHVKMPSADEMKDYAVTLAGRLLLMDVNDQQCWIDHAQEAWGELQQLLNDLGDQDKVQKDLEALQNTVMDAVNNC